MAKRSPKRQPQPATDSTADPTPAQAKKRPPPTVKNPLPPDAVRRMREFYKDSYEIERQWWRVIN
jgi:hypothetical protein